MDMDHRHDVTVRRRLTVLQDGIHESSNIAFCEAELRSVPVSQCDACRFARPKSSGSAVHGLVDCGQAILPVTGSAPDWASPAAIAAALPVGLALVEPVVSVRDTLPLADVAREPALLGWTSDVLVVNHERALVGILPAGAIAFTGNARDGRAASVADRAVSAVSVQETESLLDAFATMSVRRLRWITVVGEGLRVVGVLRDLDALRFVAHVARTSERPSPPLG